MLKKFIYISMIIFLIFIFGLFVKLIFVKSSSDDDTYRKYNHHIQVITHEKNSVFYNNLKKGLEDASEHYSILVETICIDKNDKGSYVNTLEKAVLSNVEGIAVQSLDIDETNRICEDASKRSIKMMTYENGYSDNIVTVPFIGTNSYNKGAMLAKSLITYMGNNNSKVLVFTDKSLASSLCLQGMASMFANKDLLQVCYLDGSGLDIVTKTKEEFCSKENENIKGIICTNDEFTQVIGQDIIDHNCVGAVSVVGYGNSDTINKMVSEGVVNGTVCPNAYEIGYEIVGQMYKKFNNGNANNVSTSIYERSRADLQKANNSIEQMYIDLETDMFKSKIR